MAEVMHDRELKIFGLLQEAEEFAYVPEDKSDLYALAPDSIGVGLIRVPGEYEGMNEDALNLHLQKALAKGAWEFIPLATYVR